MTIPMPFAYLWIFQNDTLIYRGDDERQETQTNDDECRRHNYARLHLQRNQNIVAHLPPGRPPRHNHHHNRSVKNDSFVRRFHLLPPLHTKLIFSICQSRREPERFRTAHALIQHFHLASCGCCGFGARNRTMQKCFIHIIIGGNHSCLWPSCITFHHIAFVRVRRTVRRRSA